MKFRVYKPWEPVAIVMSPVMYLGQDQQVDKVSLFRPLTEQLLVDSQFNSNPDFLTITVFKEYEFNMSISFIESTVVPLIDKSTCTPNMALLLTPKSAAISNMSGLNHALERSQGCQNKYMIENTHDTDSTRECFGIYIQNGAAYFFGKSKGKLTLEYHLIPETNIVVSICWESDFIGKFKREIFALASCLILHPSANSSESTKWDEYIDQQSGTPRSIMAKNHRWEKTIIALAQINPQLNFVHVDYSASGVYDDHPQQDSSVTLEREVEKYETSCVVKRVLRFSKKYNDEASYIQSNTDRKFDETIPVPESEGCSIM